MVVAAIESVPSSESPLASALAVFALFVSLLAVVVPAATGRQQRRRDDRTRRSEVYLELMELVERHGLWVVDRTYDLLETSHDDFYSEMPHRRTERPDRVLRVRARAIVSAYASVDVSRAFSRWQVSLESFEEKLDQFSFVAQEEGMDAVNAQEAAPVRDSEVAARKELADVVNSQLVQERRWRRGESVAS